MMAIEKMFLTVHKWLFRRSRGSLGGWVRGVNILILNTVGCKSGRPWAVPVGYLTENGNYVVAAFAGGAPKHPAWYYNLKKTPDVRIELQGGRTIRVHGEEAQGETRERLWQRFKAAVSESEETYSKVKRTIPVMILHPQE